MKLLLMDFETTGLDPKICRPIEFFARMWDTETDESKDAHALLFDSTYPEVSTEIFELTGIEADELRDHGKPPRDPIFALCQAMESADFVVAHNGRGYDLPVLIAECARHGIDVPKTPWIDTRLDLPYPERLRCRVLSHVALEHGFSIDPATLHRAKADVELMHMVLRKYDLTEVARIVKAPQVYLKAGVNFNSKEKAKARGFRWCQFDDSSPRFENTWVKKVRDFQVDEERKLADFTITILEV